MTRRSRIITALAACAIHLALLVPTLGEHSVILDGDFGPEAIAIEDGDRPYADQNFEYPPLAVPIVVGPALIGDGIDDYREAFQWEMILFDLGIVLLLALALRGSRERVWASLVVYTIGIVAISGLLLPDSDVEQAPLALARFDLAPAFLVLAAVLAREASRSATWSALLSAGVMLKAYPLLLYPALLRGERDLRRVVLGAIPPVVVGIGIVLAFGDEFASAITHHTGRDLQIETVAATPFELASLFGAGVTSESGSGSYNLLADGTREARYLTMLLMVAGYVLLLARGWRNLTPLMELSTALLAVTTILAPVLSPQFLFWLLPLSAAVYGLRPPNLILIAACVLTELLLSEYSLAIGEMGDTFILYTAARNLLLLVYLYLVCAPILRGRAPAPEPSPATAEPSRAPA